MLIRWATQDDGPGWISIAEQVASLFGSPGMPNDPEFRQFMDRKISQCEALVAVNRMTNECLGVISFSRAHNRVSWFGVLEKQRSRGIGSRLLRCALRQLDPSKEISVITFRDGCAAGESARHVYQKLGFVEADSQVVDPLGNPRSRMALAPSDVARGGSFHYRYPEYALWTDSRNCPVCRGEEVDNPPVLIAEMGHSWVECEKKAQGCLFGKCHVLSKVHSVYFYDLSQEDMAVFMADVQKAARALHRITGAVKINYEIHGNSMPHLHVHLFPRYLDDDFPSGPIDYRKTEPSAYESEAEFQWFVESMRALLEMDRG